MRVYLSETLSRRLRNRRYCSLKSYDVIIVGGGPTGLLSSLFLSQYDIKHAIIEKRLHPTHHPQAHYINMRSMEILRIHFPEIHQQVIEQSPDSQNWRDFTYCYSVIGRKYARIDHFQDKKNKEFLFTESPTNVTHLPQSSFEHILRQHLIDKKSNHLVDKYFGYDMIGLSNDSTQTNLQLKSNLDNTINHISSRYVIAADGANSIIRNHLNISMVGEQKLQTLINVYFKCTGLYQYLKPRPAMLYFVFNEKMVGVFVGHQPLEDLWVCQIPIFPPFQSFQDYSMDKLRDMIRYGLGIYNLSNIPVEIISTGIWTMNAEVAESFTNINQNIFLAGDSAHRFPPAGGFGMNSGLQDSHNLCWKIASVVKGLSKPSLLSTYSYERRKVAMENTKLSMINYQKSIKAAQLLGLDPKLVTMVGTIANSGIIPYPKQIFSSTLNLGLSTLWMMKNNRSIFGKIRVNMLRKLVELDEESLPLLFPKEDIGFSYSNHSERLSGIGNLFVGKRLTHIWLKVHSVSTTMAMTTIPISTLDLPNLQTIVIKTKNNIPKITIIINISQLELWIKHLSSWKFISKELYQIVAIIENDEISEKQVENEKIIMERHNQLQESFQRPRYYIDSKPDNKYSTDFIHQSAEDIFYPNRMEKSMDKSLFFIIQCKDITLKWKELCISYSKNKNKDGDKDNNRMTSVIVRPDGHVSNIFISNDINTCIKEMKDTYHLSHDCY